ncbi:MAG: hypothetical protein HUJ86_05735, partial [Synergistes sp.]|nr:hypothetical protein [Synergistes sp.]
RDKSDERKIRTYTAEDMEQIASSIKNAAIKALSGDFDAESERCAVCPWKSECAKRKISL